MGIKCGSIFYTEAAAPDPHVLIAYDNIKRIR